MDHKFDHKFFSQPDLKKTIDDAAKARSVERADIEKLFQDVRKHVVLPLENLNKNRPGNKNTEQALGEVLNLCEILKTAMIAPSEGQAIDAVDADVSYHTAAPGA
ncbi:MAG: hypothetical protein P1U32_08610 [Legionellaceae bacterium]|nr:hypothetical protein [Legionellaceae bacterium]